VNEKPLARVWMDGRMKKTGFEYTKFEDKKVVPDVKWEPKVALIKAFPNSDPIIIDWYVNKKYKGLVIEGFGLGHVPTSTLRKKDSWLPHIKSAIKERLNIVMTSQTIFGRVHPYVYRNLRLVSEAGAIYGEDMLSEVAYVKLSWVLGHTNKKEKVKEMMLTPFAHEINPRTDLNSVVESM